MYFRCWMISNDSASDKTQLCSYLANRCAVFIGILFMNQQCYYIYDITTNRPLDPNPWRVLAYEFQIFWVKLIFLTSHLEIYCIKFDFQNYKFQQNSTFRIHWKMCMLFTCVRKFVISLTSHICISRGRIII